MIYAEKMISVAINGEEVEFDVAPVIINGRTMVPMRAIFERLGADLAWDNDKKTAVANRDGIEIAIKIGENKMFKNNIAYKLDSPSLILNGRTLVPARAIAECFDCEVEWDGKNSKVIINDPKVSNTDDKFYYDYLSDPEYNFQK